jgi:peptidylprolyl isomerase domain and WD repeat-containing protein 1
VQNRQHLLIFFCFRPNTRITAICFSSSLKIVISADSSGIIEFWGSETPHEYPEHKFDFKYKMKTDLYEIAKKKAFVFHFSIAPDGSKFSAYCSDRHIRVFKLRSGKIWRSFNEELSFRIQIKNLIDKIVFADYRSLNRRV